MIYLPITENFVFKLWGIIACLLLVVTEAKSMDTQYVEASGGDLVSSLKKLKVDSVAIPSIEAINIMESAGSTKRLDAALLLIKCLAFNQMIRICFSSLSAP